MILIFVLISFTLLIFAAPDPAEATPFVVTYAISPEKEPKWNSSLPVFPLEIVVAFWFASRMFSEVLQLICSDFTEYFLDFWNILDFSSIVFYFAAFFMRFFCSDNEDQCVGQYLWSFSVPIDRLWAFYYSISVFLLWFRLLRVLSTSSSLGPLINVIIRMGQDILQFGLVWMLLIMGFSVLLRGSTVSEYQQICLEHLEDPEVDLGDIPLAACWRGWWVIRTFVQAFGGEIWLDEMQTDAALFSVMILFVVMNLLMLNLLIAIMSASYEVVAADAEKKYLMSLHSVVVEYSRRSVAAPVPTNVVMTLVELFGFFFLFRKEVSRVWPEYGWRQQLDLYLRRNMSITELYYRKVHRDRETTNYLENRPESTPHEKNVVEAHEEKVVETQAYKERAVVYRTDIQFEMFWACRMDAFMEQSRQEYMKSSSLKDLLGENDIKMWLDDEDGQDGDKKASADLEAKVTSLLQELETQKRPPINQSAQGINMQMGFPDSRFNLGGTMTGYL